MTENTVKVIETIPNEEPGGLHNKAYVDEECNNNLSEIIIEKKSEKTGGIIDKMNASFENDMKVSFSAQSSTPVNSVSVNVSNVSFSIGSTQILSNIDMRVNEGTIYCLIGPSGCGKTTLLRCIIGSLSPKSGDIQVFGYKPAEPGLQIPGRRIGYMPQETALYVDMTVSEILCFFGRVNLIERKQLQNRIDFLLAFLNLIPLKDSLIGHLSGGQKRRVSFAATLIHCPPLLILDEPTAGVDPLLRDGMWRHLIALTRLESITVILTTHYVEEARRADTLALMRLGRIVTEEPPQQFLDRMQVKSFEEGFCKLCNSDALSAQPSSNKDIYTSNCSVINETMISELRTRYKPINNSLIESSLVSYAVLRKNWTRNRKHYELFAFQFFMPVIIVVVFCFGIGAHPFHIPVAVVNDECPPNFECQDSLSKSFLNSIDPYFINQYNYTNFEEGIKAVKSGLMWAVIHIKPNFSQSLEQRLTFEFDEEEFENITIEQSTIRIYADLTNKIISITMKRVLEESFQNFAKNSLNDYGYNPRLATPPIMAGKAIYGSDNKHKGYTEFMAPAVLINISFVMAGGLTALVFILERKEGMFERQWVSGIGANQILIAHAIIRISTMVLQGIIVLSIVIIWLELPSRGPIIWIFLLLSLQNCAGMTFGLVVSALCKQENTAALTISATVMTNMALCGMIWPIEAIPYYLRWFSYIQPSTLPTEALRSLLNKGWSIDHKNVWLGFVSTILWLCLFSIMAAKFLKLK